MKIVYLDCETTGLNPRIHYPWEVATITEEPGKAPVEHVWMLPVDLSNADPRALEIGGFWERHPQGTGAGASGDSAEVARELARILAGGMVIGSNPTFDKDMISPFLAQHGQPWAAHYRMVDVVTLGAGALYGTTYRSATTDDPHALPFSTTQISKVFGINPNDYARHTALGDCRWVRDLYHAITRTGADTDE